MILLRVFTALSRMSAAAKSTRDTDLHEFFDNDSAASDISLDSPRELSDSSSDNVSSAKEMIDLDDDIESYPDVAQTDKIGESTRVHTNIITTGLSDSGKIFPVPGKISPVPGKKPSKSGVSDQSAPIVKQAPTDAARRTKTPEANDGITNYPDMNSKNRRKLRAILQ